jgi:tetratricopeptide (TPR) repeat protein
LQSLPPNEDSAFIVFYRGFAEYHKQNFSEAAAHFNFAYELDHSLLHSQVGKALSHGINHDEAKGLAILTAAEKRIKDLGVGDPEALYKVGQAFAVLGDKPSALRVLQRSIQNGFFAYPYLSRDPLLNNIRTDAEFGRLLNVARRRHEDFKRKFL